MNAQRKNTPSTEIGYAAALGELDAIVATLESSDVDVDQLAEQVRRAAELIAVCRERISGARMQIDTVIAELEASAPEALDDGDEYEVDEDGDDDFG